MKSMDKLTTGIAYGTSAGSAGYWFLQWLDQVSPSQWAAIGVLGSLVLGFLTYLTNLYFKIREDRRKSGRGTEEKKYCAGVPSSEYEEWKQNGKASGRKAGSFSGKTDAGE